ncbi:hypothetical protein AVEN_251414-1 [Araneus ventricosus]|uniref:Integrase catalytic domain-containing protein n=1 Tax=Araneus ventricosus TaxID=182803 RepID=A0A4Y2L1J6_ARAVE|nr:hypothetical protein AVEN_251414-1 [Araneus ventricosus]
MLGETTAHALLTRWISRFGTPVTTTTDQGRNFETSAIRELTNMLGSHRIHSASYHTQRLGSAVKNDLNAAGSQLVYGTTLRLPSDLISMDALQTSVTPTHVSKLVTMMRKLSQIAPVSHSCTEIYIHPYLNTCTHVFLRNDKIRPPLIPSYSGPHSVVSRTDKHFVIDLNDKSTTVSNDLLKPAYEFSEDFDSQKGTSNFEPSLTKPQIEDKISATNTRITHYCRHNFISDECNKNILFEQRSSDYRLIVLSNLVLAC